MAVGPWLLVRRCVGLRRGPAMVVCDEGACGRGGEQASNRDQHERGRAHARGPGSACAVRVRVDACVRGVMGGAGGARSGLAVVRCARVRVCGCVCVWQVCGEGWASRVRVWRCVGDGRGLGAGGRLAAGVMCARRRRCCRRRRRSCANSSFII